MFGSGSPPGSTGGRGATVTRGVHVPRSAGAAPANHHGYMQKKAGPRIGTAPKGPEQFGNQIWGVIWDTLVGSVGK